MNTDTKSGAQTPHLGTWCAGALRWFVALVIPLVSAAMAASTAGAHAKLARSVPADRSSVAEAPSRLKLWFNERIEPQYAKVSVWGAGNRQVDAGDQAIDPADPTALTVGIPNLAPGAYTVRYRVLSVDGHVVEGTLTFTVKPGLKQK
jgi:hypothetical protein